MNVDEYVKQLIAVQHQLEALVKNVPVLRHYKTYNSKIKQLSEQWLWKMFVTVINKFLAKCATTKYCNV